MEKSKIAKVILEAASVTMTVVPSTSTRQEREAAIRKAASQAANIEKKEIIFVWAVH